MLFYDRSNRLMISTDENKHPYMLGRGTVKLKLNK
jgi:hypothetical protein